MVIRFAQPQDVPGILALLRQVGNLHHESRPDIFRANAQKYSASQVLSMLNSSTSPIFVAVEEDQVLGYSFCAMQVYSRDPVFTDHFSLYIDDLCVDRAHRRKHIGTALYQEILRYAKSRGCHNVTLRVWSCNPDAAAFYQSLGMQPQTLGMEALLEES